MEPNKKLRLDPGTTGIGSGTATGTIGTGTGTGTIGIGTAIGTGTTGIGSGTATGTIGIGTGTGTIGIGTATGSGSGTTGIDSGTATGTIGRATATASGTIGSGTATGTVTSGTATATATTTIGSGTSGIGTATGSTIGSGTATGTVTSDTATATATATIGIGTSSIDTATGTVITATIGIGTSSIGTATGTTIRTGTATGTTFNGGGLTADWPFDRLMKIASVDPAFRLWMVEMLADEDPHLIFRTVFVRGFGWDASAETLRKAFEPYGHIVECRVAAGDSSLNPRCPGGIGFVVFETPESGFKATENRHKFINNRLTHTQHPFPGRPCVTVAHPNYTPVYVRDVPENGGTFYQLQILFRQFGQIVFGPFWLQLPRNYVIVVLMTAEQAAKAIEEPRKIISSREVLCFIESEAILEAAKKELMDQLEAAYTTNGHDPSSKTGLYVNHVHPELDDDKLKSFFAKFGEIVAGPIPFLLELYCSWRFALFLYKTPEEAENALLEAQGKMFDGYPLQCQASPDDFIEMAVMEEVKWCLLMAKSVVQERAEVVAQRKVSQLRKISYPNSGS